MESFSRDALFLKKGKAVESLAPGECLAGRPPDGGWPGTAVGPVMGI